MESSPEKRTYDQLAAALAKLESDAGQHLVVQRDLIHAKDQVDTELMRFKAIQRYISDALNSNDDEAFYLLTLEAFIEAFEYEVALFLLPGGDPKVMAVAAQFGLDSVPDVLSVQNEWLRREEALIVSATDKWAPDWHVTGIHQAILCPFHNEGGELAGVILGGITAGSKDYYETITKGSVSAFTVMVGQVAAVWNTRHLTAEIQRQNTRLEGEIGRYLVTQQDLIKTKNQVDEELMRFKSIQDFIVVALSVNAVEEFYVATLEAIIGAFEFEVALFLRKDHDEKVLRVVAEFGFEEIPLEFTYDDNWFTSLEAQIVNAPDGILGEWGDLGLQQAIIYPFVDKNEEFAGAILAGVTFDNTDYYDPIVADQITSFTVMVQQAGSISITRELTEEIQRQNLKLVDLTDSYSRFVPFEFLQLLERSSIEDINAGDNANLDVSVLFLDIRGFTALTEKLGPVATFAWLNDFLSEMEPLIAAENGFINQYQGDAIMALFPGPAGAALRCAEKMMRVGQDYNEKQIEAGEDPVKFGLGINSGPLLLGAIGSENRLDSNVVGDTANLAARTESLTKQYGVACIFTDRTYERVAAMENHNIRDLDEVIVKGREGSVKIFELLLAELDGRDEFDTALNLYRKGDFEQACQAFKGYVKSHADDPVARLYLSRCQNYVKEPPEFWSGISTMKDK